MITENTLTELVNYLANGDYDAQAMVVALAKVNPELFVSLAQQTREKSNNEIVFDYTVKNILDKFLSGQRVAAIRAYRESTGVSLEEAVDTLKMVYNQLLFNKVLSGDVWPCGNIPTDASVAMFKKIMAAMKEKGLI